MMDIFTKYLQLMGEHPDLFRNTGEVGEIKIIHDPIRIRAEQKHIREKLRAEGKPEHWIDIGVLSEDQWFWVIRDMVEFPDGHVWGYIRFINRKSQEGGFNVVLICNQDSQVLMIRKFHHEERGWSWKFPRGFGEPSLSAEENARKELAEEIGVKDARLTMLTNVKDGEGGTCVYLAEIPEQAQITLEVEEGITSYRWVSFVELEQLVLQGKLSDWFSLWAYTLAKMRKLL